MNKNMAYFINKKKIFFTFFLLSFFLLPGHLNACNRVNDSLKEGKHEAKEKFNILIITSDDQGINAGCYGDKLAVTPNIDRLAQDGILYTNAYVTQASCSSSRSLFLNDL